MEEKMGDTMSGALSSQGVDTRKPFMFDFFFYLPDETSAQGLANELRALGYRVAVQPGADDKIILCLATAVLVPNEREMNQLGDRFNALAAKYHGEFDGWEAGID